MRGPASPSLGAGQIGGYLNFIPKSARGDNAKYLDLVTGNVTGTFGSYDQKEVTGEAGAPLKFFGNDAGIYGFLELTDSGSFYIGQHPETQIAQLTFNTDLGSVWTFSASAQFISSSGALKDIGWNRVTQDLINNGNYTSGMALTKIAGPNDAFITPADWNAALASLGPKSQGIEQYNLPLFGIFGESNKYTKLDPATVKTVKLSPRVTDISSLDINDATTPLLYAGFTGDFGDYGNVKLETFTQYLDSKNYQSYGFATLFRTYANEERATYNYKWDFGDFLKTQTVVGASYRTIWAYSAGTLQANILTQDRRDLSQPVTPDEILNDNFLEPGYQWNTAVSSVERDFGLFLMEDLLLLDHFDVTTGVRNDSYDINAVDNGTNPNGSYTAGTHYKASASPTSYSVSISLPNDWAVPYGTYAKSYSLNVDQGGAIVPQLIFPTAQFLGTSSLWEAGLKTSQFDGHLYAAIDYYLQKNQYLDSHAKSVSAQRSQGFEGELRYLITKELGMTATATLQQVRQLAAGSGPYLTLTPSQVGVAGVDGYGGYYATNAEFIGLGKGYQLHTTPKATLSAFGTYNSEGVWGLTGGVVYNTWTGGSVPGSIRLPGYMLVKAGIYGIYDDIRVDLNVDNLFDKRYFIAEYDVDSTPPSCRGSAENFTSRSANNFLRDSRLQSGKAPIIRAVGTVGERGIAERALVDDRHGALQERHRIAFCDRPFFQVAIALDQFVIAGLTRQFGKTFCDVIAFPDRENLAGIQDIAIGLGRPGGGEPAPQGGTRQLAALTEQKIFR